MEGSNENPNGAGDHQNDAARRAEAARRSMMEDLGLGRLEDCARDDGRQAYNIPANTQPRQLTEGNRLWHTAIQNQIFNDSDARTDEGLETIADGRLHSFRQTGPQGLSQSRTAQSQHNYGPRSNMSHPASTSMYNPRRPQGRAPRTPMGHSQGPTHASGHVSRNGIFVQDGMEVRTLSSGNSTSATPQRASTPSNPSQPRQRPTTMFDAVRASPATTQTAAIPSNSSQLRQSATVFDARPTSLGTPQAGGRSSNPSQLQQRPATLFDATNASSTLNESREQPATNGSNTSSTQCQPSTMFSRASVAGPPPRVFSASSQTNGATNVPPHLRTAPRQRSAALPGPASGAEVPQAPQSDLNQRRINDASQLPRLAPDQLQRIDTIFESDVSISHSKLAPDGKSPSVGKVLLYEHPRVHGWIIFELQAYNGYLTRIDVREFINSFTNDCKRYFFRFRIPNGLEVHNLSFPDKEAAEKLGHLLGEIKKGMDQINAPRFEQSTLKVQKLGEIDIFTLQGMPEIPKSGEDSSLIDNASPMNGDTSAQEDTSSSPAKLIDLEEDNGMGKRLASEDLKDLKYEANLSSSEAEPHSAIADKQPLEIGKTEESSMANSLNTAAGGENQEVAYLIDIHGNTSEANGLGAESGAEHDSGFDSKPTNKPVNKSVNKPVNEPANAPANEPANAPEQTTSSGQASVHISIKLHDVDRVQPVLGVLSSAAKNLVSNLTSGKLHSMADSVKGLFNGYVLVGVFTNRRLDNAILLTALQTLCQNSAFRGFETDEKLKTTAWVYKKLHKVLKDRRITYSPDHLMILGDQPYCPTTTLDAIDEMPDGYKTPSKRTSTTAVYRQEDIQKVAPGSAQFLGPSATGSNRASSSRSLESRREPGRLTPPPEFSESKEQQAIREVTPEFNSGLNHFSSPITPAPSTDHESAVKIEPRPVIKPKHHLAAVKPEPQPVVKTEPQPVIKPKPHQVVPTSMAQAVTTHQPKAPVKQEETSVFVAPQISSPLTPTQNSQVPGNRTGSQGSRSVESHMRGIRQNLGSAGLSGSRWA
ncbi:hypothetical protein PG989_015743 [Apiospora arundinis]